MKIRDRLMLWCSSCVLALGLLAAAVISHQQEQQIMSLACLHADELAAATAGRLAAVPVQHDGRFEAYARRVFEISGAVAFARVRGAAGAPLATFSSDGAGPVAPGAPGHAPGCRIEGRYAVAEVSLPPDSGQSAAWLTLGISLERWQQACRSIRAALFAAAVALALATLLLCRYLGEAIARPINRITALLTDMACGRFPGAPAAITHGEAGKLAAAVNEMIVRLERTIHELERSEHNYRLHFEQVSDLVYTVNDRLEITGISPSVAALLGYAAGELRGKPLSEARMLGAGSLPAAISDIRWALSGERISSAQYELIDRNGTRKTFETSISPLRETGGVAAVLCVARDVTERRRVLEELRNTRDYLDNIIDSSQEGIVVTDSTAHITRVNRYVVDLLELRDEREAVGRYISEFIPPGTGQYPSRTGEQITITDQLFDDARAVNEELFEKGKVTNWESFLIARSGVLVPVELSIVMLYNRQGERIGSVGALRDITGRKKVEGELRDAYEFLERIIEGSWDGILITNKDGEIITINGAMERMTGYSRQQLAGKKMSTLAAADTDMLERIPEKTEELYRKGVATFEMKQQTRDGTIIEVEYNTSMIKDEKGEYIAAVSIVRDVSERKRIESRLIQSEKLKSLGELAGGVAHDFNNVLAAILGRAQLLQMNLHKQAACAPDAAAQTELMKGLQIIEKAARDAADTVRRIQEFSRRSDRDRPFEPVDINELLDDSMEFTRTLWKDEAEARGLAITINRRYGVVPHTTGLASELREVFTNIIKNAVEAMPAGGALTIETRTQGSDIVISLQDTGIGIAADGFDRVFDPFFTTKGPQATGLGMSVSYGIIHRHQGEITFESTPGNGACFTVQLPVTKPSRTAAHAAQQQPAPGDTATILIIDDEQDVRDTLTDILSVANYRVVSASNGEQGITLFRRKNIDMVFTDLGMPGMSGYQVAHALKQINFRIPVFLITGWQVDSTANDQYKECIDKILNKPFHFKQILALVQEGIDMRRRNG